MVSQTYLIHVPLARGRVIPEIDSIISSCRLKLLIKNTNLRVEKGVVLMIAIKNSWVFLFPGWPGALDSCYSITNYSGAFVSYFSPGPWLITRVLAAGVANV